MNDNERQAKNWELAQLLGWSIGMKTEPTFQGSDTVTIRGLLDPQGELVYFHPLTDKWPESEAYKHVPDFYGSLDAVTEALPPDASLYVDLMIGGGVTALIHTHTPDGKWNLQTWHAAGATRQWAAAAALYEYAKAKKQQVE